MSISAEIEKLEKWISLLPEIGMETLGGAGKPVYILDLIIIPGIVFDKNKNRIGFGGGYYDKFLYKLKENHNKNNTKLPLIVAVCYDFQLLNSIPYEKHDIKPDIIITEKQTIK